MAIIFFDGGIHQDLPKNAEYAKKISMTCGILLHVNDTQIEASLEHIVEKKYVGLHEYVAFVEAFKLLRKNNIDYKKVAFYTDAEEIAYAQHYLHKENYEQTKRENFLNVMNRVLNIEQLKINEESVDFKNDLLDCLLNSRFVKVKGHSNTIDNIRVDYLCKSAHKKKQPIAYEQYINLGFIQHTREEKKQGYQSFMPRQIKY